MFAPMRRFEKQMSEQEAIDVLCKAKFGTLACIDKNGYPYSVPLNFAFKDNTIYFHSATTGVKLENIRNNEKVCFSAVSYEQVLAEKFDTEYDSVIAFGEAMFVSDEQEKRRALMLLIEKYSPEYCQQGSKYIEKSADLTVVVKIEVRHMTGKRGR